MQPRVYSYIRFSDPEQAKGHSRERQLSYAQNYAKTNKMALDESLTMRDEGLSAYHQMHIKRGAFGMFLSAIETGKVPEQSVLIIESLDRISRAKPRIALSVLLQIIEANITVITACDNKVYNRETIDNDGLNLFSSLFIFSRANEESETKSRRVKASIEAQIKKRIETGSGQIIRNGQDPYWCKPNKDKSGFDLIDDRVNIIKDIISKYRKGWGYHKITRYLNDNCKPFNNKQWYVGYIVTFIKNRTLIGERSFAVNENDYVIKEYYPAVLTQTEFYELQNEIKQRASTKAQGKYLNILTGMKVAYCGYCQSTISAQNYTYKENKGKLANGFRRLRCTAETFGRRCENTRSTSVTPLEKCILEYCITSEDFAKTQNNDNDKTAIARHKLANIHEKIDANNKQMATAESSVLQLLSQEQSISPAINNLIEKIRIEQKSLQDEKVKIEDLISFQSNHVDKDISKEWQAVKEATYNLDEESRLLIRQLVKRTFKRIDVFLHGMQLSSHAVTRSIKKSLGTGDNTIDLILTFHNDKTRILSIDKKTGSWVNGGDFMPESAPPNPAESLNTALSFH